MRIFLLAYSLLAFSAHSKEKIAVAFGDALAPWVLPASNSGILVDIVKEALEPLGYAITLEYYPYLRRLNSFRANQVDVVSDINVKTLKAENLTGYLVENVYAYENYAFSLHENNFQFKHISELSNYSLLSWQGAITHLGGDYAKMAKSNPNYVETHNQLAQLKMLFRKRVQVIQLDDKIFNYYRLQLINEKQEIGLAKIDKFALLGPSPNGFLFKSEKVKNDFLEQITLMKQDGRYDAIVNKYAPVID